MPGGDRTGPMGYGPMTGRGLGYCAGYAVPGYMNPVGGFGYGRGWWGRGGGRGWRNMYYATGRPGWARFGYAAPTGWAVPWSAPTAEQELNALKAQAEAFDAQLEAINARIAELTKESE